MNTANLNNNNLTAAKNECTHNVLDVRQAPVRSWTSTDD